MNSLDRRVVGKGVRAELASDTGLLESTWKLRARSAAAEVVTSEAERTEGDLGVELVVAVDPDGSGLELVGGADGTGDVAREDGGGETVHRVVGLGDDVGLVLELGHDDDGAEDLLLDDAHVGLDVGEDGGLDEEALGAVALASGVDGRALLLAALDVRHDSVVLELRSLGALERVRREGGSDLKRLDLLREEREELVVDALLDVDARAGAAALAVVEEESESGPSGGLLDVGVVEDDVGRLRSGGGSARGKWGSGGAQRTFPPSSRVTFLRFEVAAAFMMVRPTSVEPVNATLEMRMCDEMAAPVMFPYPVMMLTTPGGKTLAIRVAAYMALSGVVSATFC